MQQCTNTPNQAKNKFYKNNPSYSGNMISKSKVDSTKVFDKLFTD